MSIRDLLKDRDIISDKLEGEQRTLAKDFVARRVRLLIRANPDFNDPGKPGDLTDIATKGVAIALIAEVPKVLAALTAIQTRINADVKKGLHVPIGSAAKKRVRDRPPTGDAGSMRQLLVLSIVFQATAWDIRLAEPANLERLHQLCDRRLRLVERMLYDVGSSPARSWTEKQISAHAGGPWNDGLERAFEYPRVPREAFLATCRPDAKDSCQAPMEKWTLGDDKTIVGPLQTNPGTTDRWRYGKIDNYALEYTPKDPAKPKAVEAIVDLFKPSTDFLQRNLMYCDHTIHSLHLEALVFAESKRRTAGDTAWLDSIVAAKPRGWLRLYHPLVSPGADQPEQGKFLTGSGEPAFFEHITVQPEELQVGDHLIIYNHPAYEHSTLHGAWRLENAVVVQTTPELLVQGHGSEILTLSSAKAVMVELFRKALDRCRAALRPVAQVTANGTAPKTLQVNSTAALQVRMKIDIVDAVTEAPLAVGRLITSVDPRTKIVGYDGAAVTATAKHVLRRAHVRQFSGKFESLQIESNTSDDALFLLRRFEPAKSEFAPGSRDGDWYVAWLAKEREDKIRLDAKRADFVKKKHFVDYTVETEGTTKKTVGWFPLYQPVTEGGKPVMKDGKITGIKPTAVNPENIAAWTWFADPDMNAAIVPVIRPKV